MTTPVATNLGQTPANNVATVNYIISYTPTPLDYILLAAIYNEHQGSSAAIVSSITSPGLTWALRKRSNASPTGCLELWWAHGTVALPSYTISVHFSGAYDNCSICFAGVTGCGNPAMPFDVNAGLPAAQSAPGATWTPSFTGVSTANANDLLLFLSGSENNVPNAPAPATGFTNIVWNYTGLGAWSSGCWVDGRGVSALQAGATFTLGAALTSPYGSISGEAIFDALSDAGAPAASQARAMVMA